MYGEHQLALHRLGTAADFGFGPKPLLGRQCGPWNILYSSTSTRAALARQPSDLYQRALCWVPLISDQLTQSNKKSESRRKENLERRADKSNEPALLLAPRCWCGIWTNAVICNSRRWCGNEKEKLAGKRENKTIFRVVRPSSRVIDYIKFSSISCKFLTKISTNFFLTLTPFSFLSLYRVGRRDGLMRFETQSLKSWD